MSATITRFTLPLLLLCAALLSACDKSSPAPSSSPAAAAQAQQVYRVGTDAAYAPMEMMVDGKQPTGFDIDLMSAIAERGGFRIEFINTPFESIFNSLLQGDRDLLISAITITPERLRSVSFSEPYFEARQLIVTVGGQLRVRGAGDLSGLKVGVQSATTGDIAMQKLLGRNNTAIRRFESMPLALAELTAGGVDAVVGDEAVVRHFIAGSKGAGPAYRIVADDNFGKEYYGIAVRPGDQALLERINRGLAAVRADGTYERIRARYFGS
ncbi:basic amino acid ABC transporter substrate-binding protein [Herbaspirillum sp. LeCh32-8]|uniref:basic amino acid ABC transporter substrate-binding protein n=1 Tax=Herbaspirillum sp. LeCh32-8 TaxID=2821356 RepID=UPI001AE40E52|nr:basic amino acid ABC transporter substrate-binding protein [Herbaspirillum sp. LeCh32-8]MBP0600381.1 basic amino acid ABC transporter substrate-binding protein [Herbaspirillum sp. LeCh32-8]